MEKHIFFVGLIFAASASTREDLERGVTKRVALSFEDYDMYRPELEKLLLRALRDGKTGIFLITATHECEAESEG